MAQEQSNITTTITHPGPSPILNLSTDLLQKIFLYAISVSPACGTWDPQSKWWTQDDGLVQSENQPIPYGPQFGDPGQSPWSVSRVNQQWRAIALKTPHLWSYLEICFDYKNMRLDLEKSIAKLLTLALERSMPCGLDLVLGAIKSGVGMTLFPAKIAEVLLQHTIRWERVIAFDVSFPWTSARLAYKDGENDKDIAIPALAFPRLKALTVDKMSNILPPNFWTPRLQTIFRLKELDDVDIGELQPGLPLRHSRALFGLESGASRFVKALTAFNQMEGLTTLTLSFNHSWVDTAPSTFVTLHHVTALNLGMLGTRAVECVLSKIAAPALRSLRMLYLDNPSPLISFLERSACQLHALRIYGADLGSQDISDILIHTPELADLHLSFFGQSSALSEEDEKHYGPVDDALLEGLVGPGKGVLPKLRSLALFNVKDLNVPRMMELLKMRLSPEAVVESQLERIKLGIAGYDDEDALTPKHKELLRDLRVQRHVYVQMIATELDNNSVEGSPLSEGELTDDSASSEEDSEREEEMEDDPETRTTRLLELDEDSDYVPSESDSAGGEFEE